MAGILLILASCGSEKNQNVSQDANDGNILRYARNIKLVPKPEGWYEVKVTNPWDTLSLLQTLALVPREMETAELKIPDNAEVIRVPLESSLITSTVHIGLLEEFGAIDAVTAVTDADFIKSDLVEEKIQRGEIVNCGRWLEPDIEKMILLSPEAVLISPYQNGGNYSHLADRNIPVIYVADYMEQSPLGKAEWMRYYGLLYGKGEKADSIFSSVAQNYEDLKEKYSNQVGTVKSPKVLFDVPQSGIWYVPVGGSYNDILISDSGGNNPFSRMSGDRFKGISPEKVLYDAGDADFWLIRQNSNSRLTKKLLEKDITFASQFKAFKEDNVWGCNTGDTRYFEETPFHPDRLLEEYCRILYDPEVPDSLYYFKKIK